MSMFQIGLSGLQSTQSALEITSNNIANSSTAGYKSSTAEFAAVYNGGQRGGVTVANIKEDFNTSGSLVRTDNALDLAITGSGFFVLDQGGREAYTQAGQFGLDNNLNIVNNDGAKLQGYGIDEQGNIVPGVMTDLQIQGSNIAARASDSMAFAANFSSASDIIPYPTTDAFDPTNGASYNFSQSTEVFDSLGNSHVMTQYFNHTANNEWQAMYFVDGQPLAANDLQLSGGTAVTDTQTVTIDGNDVDAGVVTLNFDNDGTMQSLGTEADSYAVAVTIPGTLTNANAIALNLDMTGSTQYGSGFSMYNNQANGYTSGEFSGVTVDDDGNVFATFTNGESKLQGQLIMATFSNVNGLEAGNNTVWYSTEDSGAPLYTTAASGTAGDLLSGQYMNSNVDISEELVDLVSFQQNYQANARTISTANQMMQTLFNNL